MNRIKLCTFFLLLFSQQGIAQLELAPRTLFRPALLRTDNASSFNLGLQETSVVNITSNLRMGLGTEFTSNSFKQYVEFAKFHIRHNSSGQFSQSTGSAHLLLDEAESNDFARLRFSNSSLINTGKGIEYSSSTRFWDIAGRSYGTDKTNDRLHFFNSDTGNILSISGDSKVGINNSNPDRSLDVAGTARVTGYTETGDLSISYKTKLIAFTSFPFSCSGGATYDFSLGVNENRVISADVLVQTGTGSFYPPNDWFNNNEYSYRIDGSSIYFEFRGVAGCSVASRGFRVWLTYADSAISMPTGNGP